MSSLDARRERQLEIARKSARHNALPVLNPGERIIWTGYCQSKVGQQSKAAPGATIKPLFSIFGPIFMILVVGGGVSDALDSAAGFLAGILLAPVPVWYAQTHLDDFDSVMYCRQQTVYLLTDERVVVVRNCNRGVPVQSLPLRFIDRIRVTDRRTDDRGTVEFLVWDAQTQTWTIPLRFFRVQNPDKVSDLAEAWATGRGEAQGSLGSSASSTT